MQKSLTADERPGHATPRRGYRELAIELRERIVSGRLAAGARLPTKLALCKEYRVSDATMQRALNILHTEGFIRSRGCAGTWVSDSPPNLCRVGIVFPGAANQSLFWTAIQRETERLGSSDPGSLQFTSYFNCRYPITGTDFERLQEDLRASRLAGIFLLVNPAQLFSQSLLKKGGLISISLNEQYALPGGYFVRMQHSLPRALSYLHAKGKRRVAFISAYAYISSPETLIRLAREHHLETYSKLIHFVAPQHQYTAVSIMELMLSLPASSRPDAVCILDDHLVRHVTAGMKKTGVAIGPDQELEVVAHANLPYVQTAHVPVTFLGYDIRGLIEQIALRVNGARAGKSFFAPAIEMNPIFARELSCPLIETAL